MFIRLAGRLRTSTIGRQLVVSHRVAIKRCAVVIDKINLVAVDDAVVRCGIDRIAGNGCDSRCPPREGIGIFVGRHTCGFGAREGRCHAVVQRVGLERRSVVVHKVNLIAVGDAVIDRRVGLVRDDGREGRCPTRKAIRVLSRRRPHGFYTLEDGHRAVLQRIGLNPGAVVVVVADGIAVHDAVVHRSIDSIVADSCQFGRPAGKRIGIFSGCRTRGCQAAIRRHHAVVQRVGLQFCFIVVLEDDFVTVDHAVVDCRIDLVGSNSRISGRPTGKAVGIFGCRLSCRFRTREGGHHTVVQRVGYEQHSIVVEVANGIAVDDAVIDCCIGLIAGDRCKGRCPTRKAVSKFSRRFAFGQRRRAIARPHAIGKRVSRKRRTVVIYKRDSVTVHHAVIDCRINLIAGHGRISGCPAGKRIGVLSCRLSRRFGSHKGGRHAIVQRVECQRRSVVVNIIHAVAVDDAVVLRRVGLILRYCVECRCPTCEGIGVLRCCLSRRRDGRCRGCLAVAQIGIIQQGIIVVHKTDCIQQRDAVVLRRINLVSRYRGICRCPSREGIFEHSRCRASRIFTRISRCLAIVERVKGKRRTVIIHIVHTVTVHHAVVGRGINLIGCQSRKLGCPTGKRIGILRRRRTGGFRTLIGRHLTAIDSHRADGRAIVVHKLYLHGQRYAVIVCCIDLVARHGREGGCPALELIAVLQRRIARGSGTLIGRHVAIVQRDEGKRRTVVIDEVHAILVHHAVVVGGIGLVSHYSLKRRCPSLERIGVLGGRLTRGRHRRCRGRIAAENRIGRYRRAVRINEVYLEFLNLEDSPQ